MNQNTEYEKFAQDVYQELMHAEWIHTIDVKHNIKLTGQSGQERAQKKNWGRKI